MKKIKKWIRQLVMLPDFHPPTDTRYFNIQGLAGPTFSGLRQKNNHIDHLRLNVVHVWSLFKPELYLSPIIQDYQQLPNCTSLIRRYFRASLILWEWSVTSISMSLVPAQNMISPKIHYFQNWILAYQNNTRVVYHFFIYFQ